MGPRWLSARARLPRPARAASLLAPVLPDRLTELHAGAVMRGAIFGAYPLTVALVSLFVPRLADRRAPRAAAAHALPLTPPDAGRRFGRRPLLVLGLAAEGALVIVFGAVRPARHHHGGPAGSHGANVATLWVYLALRILTVRAPPRPTRVPPAPA